MDAHCEKLLQDFREAQGSLYKLRDIVGTLIRDALKQNGISVAGYESRVKAEKSLAGKLELKGQKYAALWDITDLLGARIITFYSDEVDKIASLVENIFEIDWENSVDKRKLYDTDRFGYMSLHYICRIPESLYHDETMPAINRIRFEIQIRTALQHVWATVNHDMGYKTDVDIPKEYARRLSCMAGLLEVADREFLAFRNEVEDYRRKVHALIHDGKFDDITLDSGSFDDYLEMHPFDSLNERIASINHAEVQEVSLKPYLPVLRSMGLETLGDVERMKNDCFEDAYNLARYQVGNTDLDILASSVGISSLCMVFILKNGGGEAQIIDYYDTLYGKRPRNEAAAKRILEQAHKVNII